LTVRAGSAPAPVHVTGARRINPRVNQISVLRVKHHGSLVGALSNKEKL